MPFRLAFGVVVWSPPLHDRWIWGRFFAKNFRLYNLMTDVLFNVLLLHFFGWDKRQLDSLSSYKFWERIFPWPLPPTAAQKHLKLLRQVTRSPSSGPQDMWDIADLGRTVDASEIRRSPPGYFKKKTCKKWDFNYQPQLLVKTGFLKHQEYDSRHKGSILQEWQMEQIDE